MKKLFYSLAVIALISILSSCTPKPEEQILGTWTLDGVEIENIDEIAQSMLDLQTGMIDEQIALLEEQVATIEEEMEAELLQTQLDELTAQKAELTIENFKEEFNAQFEESKGKYKIEFLEDFTYKMTPDEEEGTWVLNEDGTELTFSGGDEDQALTITELTAENLVLRFEQGEAETKMVMIMSFVKGESEATETTDETEEEITE